MNKSYGASQHLKALRRPATVQLPPVSRLQWRLLASGLMLIAALFWLPAAQAASTSDAPFAGNMTGASDQPTVQRLLDAIAEKDYQGFVEDGTPEFSQITEAQFAQVAGTVGPRLEKGYTATHMGNLRQQGLDISVWKISFDDEGDDLLATLNVQDGKVGGFYLR